MARLLYLVHRMPYPPNKGDKVRSYHLLRQLLAHGHEVVLGSFVDDPEDWAHEAQLREWCAEVCLRPLSPRTGKLRSLTALASGQPLTLRYYHDAGLARWVDQQVAAGGIDAAIVFSSSMAPYALAHPQLPLLTDLVDVDSAKWAGYAERHPWPLSWLYRREGRTLLAYEAEVVRRSRHAFLVTEPEVALLERLAPATRGRVLAMGNGVDADFFTPDAARPRPEGWAADEPAVVFTGAMDYWPNVDAVQWFAAEMLPELRRRHPRLRLHVVGRAPTPAVQALAGEAVVVTGTVPDVRPWLQHAAVVVAPLRLARGVQNKVLEAMAMGRPVVAAAGCVGALDAVDGRDLLAAETPEDYVRQIDALLRDRAMAARIGLHGQNCVAARYSWAGRLAPLERFLRELGSPVASGAGAAVLSAVPGPLESIR
ncbi:MAG: hypothetical protein RLY78_1404 [Pseudomonadota bacterium]